MDIHLELPTWMVERIVDILSKHPYTGAEDIIREIKKQTADNPHSEENHEQAPLRRGTT